MNTQDTKYWQLFLKQEAGTLTAAERQQLDNWLAENPEHREKFHGFEALFQASQEKETLPDFNAATSWPDMKAQIMMNTDTRRDKIIRVFPWVARVAAAVLLLLGTVFIFYQYANLQQEPQAELTLAGTSDNLQKITLSDGTTVWLNRDSELLYPKNFDGATRTVYLKGEGYFEVTPNKQKPFVVRSGLSKTTVLGTSFNLRSYADEQETKLTVMSGRVTFAINDDREKLTVKPGESATLANATRILQKETTTDVNVLSWKTGHLAFNNTQLKHIVTTLSKHFHTHIILQNPALDNCRFTGDFQDSDAESALKIITRATGTTYKIHDDQCIIGGKGCQN